MQKSCTHCSATLEITNDDLAFYDNISPIFAGRKFSIPPPTHCPDCRQQRRLAICNERYLYPGKCGMCGERTLTEFPPHLGQPIYCRECWHGDKWDPRDYGRDFDFGRTFAEQFSELRKSCPAQALAIDGTIINSEYIHYAGSSKNCYLIMHADFCEDCYYGYGFKKNTSCVDGFYNLHCELCYDCVDVHKCYDLKGSQDCVACDSSAFIRDCVGCRNCFLCVGLRNKEYCFENKQMGKEEYKKRVAELDTGSYTAYQECKKRLAELERKHTFKEFHGHNLQNCLGDHLNNCKDVTYSFDCEDVEGAKFCYQMVLGSKNIYDMYQFGTNLQQSYEGAIVGDNSYHIYFTHQAITNCSELFYCWYLERSKNCFGCTNMQAAQYCVLNKQYSREEWERLVPRIIEHMQRTGEWGEFLPKEVFCFGYNKTTAQMYYPLSKEQALAGGFKWDDYELPQPDVANKITAADLPDNIDDVMDDILERAIECKATGKLFKITPRELKFYREQRIPLPRRHYDQRHLDRFARRNPRRFWKRECMCDKDGHGHVGDHAGGGCAVEFLTSYSPERPEIVYCEACYMKTVY